MKKVTALLLGLVCLFYATGIAAADEENAEVKVRKIIGKSCISFETEMPAPE